MTLPAVPNVVTPPQEVSVRDALTRLYSVQFPSLRARIPADQLGLPVPTAIDTQQQAVANSWATLAADLGPLSGQPAFRDRLNAAVVSFDQLEAAIDAAYPAAPAAAAVPVGAAGLAQLTTVVGRVRKFQQLVALDTAGAPLAGLFGPANVAVARTRVGQIAAALENVLSQTTEATTAGSGAGFVPNPALPATMKALARGAGPNAIISVPPSALAPGDDFGLVTALVHEGSHILVPDATVDFAYRAQGAHYGLPPELAIDNAAHYEQLAINLAPLQAGEVRPPAVPPDASLLGLAMNIVRSKVTRAWVRAWDLKAATNAGRAAVGDLLGARTATVGADIANALFANLFESMNSMMRLALGNLSLQAGPAVMAMPVMSIPNAATPAAAATTAIGMLTQHLAGTAITAVPPVPFATFIDRIQDYDRGPLRPQLAAYYERYGAGWQPVGAGQVIPH